MPDRTYSVRIDDTTQERLKKLTEESGISSKEFFSNMIAVYEMQQIKESIPTIGSDIEELELITRRIYSIFINMGERFKTQEQNDAQKEKDIYNQIKELKTKNDEYEKELSKIASQKEESELKIEELKEILEDKSELINEYKNKLKIQESQAKEVDKLIEENKMQAEQIKSLEASCAKLKEEYNTKLHDINQKHIESISEMLKAEKEKQTTKRVNVRKKEVKAEQ